jgi:hypothetical protein
MPEDEANMERITQWPLPLNILPKRFTFLEFASVSLKVNDDYPSVNKEAAA